MKNKLILLLSALFFGYLATKGIMQGEVLTELGSILPRDVTRTENPILFWIEIGFLYLFAIGSLAGLIGSVLKSKRKEN